MLFTKRLHGGGHTRELVVEASGHDGWEVREAADDQVIRQSRLHDWRHVEKAMLRFAIVTFGLERDGWREGQAPASSVV